ncbi:MAG: ATP-dependent metallopeptidase FtsH/Yme1/Tma family protein, partial [Pseudonocardiaceae bacterium]
MKLKRLLRGPFIWITVLLIVALATLSTFARTAGPKDIPYNEFVGRLEAGQVRTVTDYTQDHRLEGELADKTEYRVNYNPDLNGQQLSNLLAEAELKPYKVDNQPRNLLLSLLFQFLPIILIFALFLFFMSQMQGGGNRVMSFGKSRAKVVSKDQPKVTFADVAGVDEAVEELREIKEFLES